MGYLTVEEGSRVGESDRSFSWIFLPYIDIDIFYCYSCVTSVCCSSFFMRYIWRRNCRERRSRKLPNLSQIYIFLDALISSI